MLIILFYLLNFNCNQFKYDFGYNSYGNIISVSCLKLLNNGTEEKEEIKIIFHHNLEIKRIQDPSNIDPALIRYTIFFIENHENGKGKIGRFFFENKLYIVRYDNEGKKIGEAKIIYKENINNDNFIEHQVKDEEIEEVEIFTEYYENLRPKIGIVKNLEGTIIKEYEYDEEGYNKYLKIQDKDTKSIKFILYFYEYDEKGERKNIIECEYDENKKLQNINVIDKNGRLLKVLKLEEDGKTIRSISKIKEWHKNKTKKIEKNLYIKTGRRLVNHYNPDGTLII